jgi:peptide/nickel transport system substrate-binding protein
LPLTHTRWPFFVALIAGALTIAVFWYIVLSKPSGEAVPVSGGHYTEGVVRGPDRINPLFVAGNTTDADLASLVFSGLVRLGPDGTPLPDLAERWEITGNGRSYVFHLRRGVAWHDGEAFDATDVVYTFKAIGDPGFKGDRALSQLMQGVVVTARDPLTVEFKLEQAYAPFLAYLTVGILPEHLLQKLDANQLFNTAFNQQPIGTGPYRFKSRSEDSVDLAPNSTYFLGPPKISKLTFRVFPDEPSLLAALGGHSIDGALLGPDTQRSDLEMLRGDSAYTVHDLTATSYYILYLDTRLPVFDDKAVRQALLQGVNLQWLLDSATGGRGVAADTGIPPQSWAHTGVTVPAFDPGAAASALEVAGWSRASDGVRANGDERLSFTLSAANDALSVAIASNVAQQWRALGVDAQIQPLSASSFVDEHLLARKFEAALAAVDPGPDPDPYPFWHSSQIAPPGRNLASYNDSRIDDKLERARQTTDTARRKSLYAEFAGYLIAGTPAIPLFSPVYAYVQNKQAQGFADTLLFAPASRFANVYEWYMQTGVQ